MKLALEGSSKLTNMMPIIGHRWEYKIDKYKIAIRLKKII